ncbi:hypothetical protein ACXYUI_33100, partial [Klebsiella pneumoniae]
IRFHPNSKWSPIFQSAPHASSSARFVTADGSIAKSLHIELPEEFFCSVSATLYNDVSTAACFSSCGRRQLLDAF